MLRAALIVLLSGILFCGCSSRDTWKHPLRYDKERLGEDAKECKAYARDVTKEERTIFRIPAGTPHGGVAEAFIIFAMFQEAFMQCMDMKGWVYTETQPSALSSQQRP
ncbi:MAG TPA: hypothetical protein PLX02_00920 [Syntrophorhabdaceae bacterium]|nr:hypothetical protein [Syntrophorhabdaceae bacterium]HQM80160.1 hypothetical protein [Syntrophorhabdaceae bacterium]